jgi:hypothetical protein
MHWGGVCRRLMRNAAAIAASNPNNPGAAKLKQEVCNSFFVLTPVVHYLKCNSDAIRSPLGNRPWKSSHRCHPYSTF